MSTTVGYYDFRGFASPIKYLLEYVGEDYVENIYPIGEKFEESTLSFEDYKESLGLQFNELPYLIDDDVKLTKVSLPYYFTSKHVIIDRGRTFLRKTLNPEL